MDSIFVRGIESTPRLSEVAKLTQWREVTPLELKLTVLYEKALEEERKIDFDKENNCPICSCELYEGLFTTHSIDSELHQQSLILD